MTTQITVLASGSKGNAILIHDEIGGVLIDAGLRYNEMLKRLKDARIKPEIIKAVCVTHAHSDHVAELERIVHKFNIAVYISEPACQWIIDYKIPRKQLNTFNAGDCFFVGSYNIQPFSVSHDADGTTGFTITSKHSRVGIATDLGIADDSVIGALKGCNTIMLESNYDESLLRQSSRPQVLKNRISGDKGHLSNKQCAEALQKIVTPDTTNIVLCHLSQRCNKPELALETARNALPEDIGVKVYSACQDEILTLKKIVKG